MFHFYIFHYFFLAYLYSINSTNRIYSEIMNRYKSNLVLLVDSLQRTTELAKDVRDCQILEYRLMFSSEIREAIVFNSSGDICSSKFGTFHEQISP